MSFSILQQIERKEFLISELHRFKRENGRNPRQVDMCSKNGYPTAETYQSYFGSFNNGLIVANLPLNKTYKKRTGTEVCYICNSNKGQTRGWITKGVPKGKVMCPNCYQKLQTNYMNGILDKNSSVAKGFVSQIIVANVLGLSLENDCNCSIGFNHPYDLYDKGRYEYINVKSAHLYNNNAWYFGLKQKEIPDTYICLGFDENRKNIKHVWVVNSNDKLVLDNFCILITNNVNTGLKRAEPGEVDAKPYNDMLHQMSKKRKDTNGEKCVLSNDDLNI